MKTIIQILVSLVATAVLVIFFVWASDSPAVHNPAFAFVLNWLVLVWVMVIAGVFQSHLSLGPQYYRIRTFERNGRIYERLGVSFLKKLLHRGPLSTLNPKVRLSGGRSALSELEQNMRAAETGHMVVFLTMLVISGYPLLQGWWQAFGWWLLFNVLINVYPVMLQRCNRARLSLLVERLERSKAIKGTATLAKQSSFIGGRSDPPDSTIIDS